MWSCVHGFGTELEWNSLESEVYYSHNVAKLADHSYFLFRNMTGIVAYFSLVICLRYIILLITLSPSFWLFHSQKILIALFSPAFCFSQFWLVCSKYHYKKMIFLLYYLDYIFTWFKPGHGWIKLNKHVIIDPFPLTDT